jgi:two-component system, sensor histidine kinase PdtaS
LKFTHLADRRFANRSFDFSRLSTSARLIVILSLALMPLGFVALLASLQSARTADAQRRAELRIATSEATRKLATVVMKAAVGTLDAAPDSTEPCLRVQALLAARSAKGVPFALFSAGPLPVCSTKGGNFSRPAVLVSEGDVAARIVGTALETMVRSPSGSSLAVARYPAPTLAVFARPGGYGSPYQMTIDTDGSVLTIVERSDSALLQRIDQVTMSLGVGRLSLTMTASRAPFGAVEALLTFLPLLMWASAAAVGFYVVDRLLIRPLKSLRAAVASYEPGSSRLVLAETPAIEIRELEASFTAFADRLADREREVEAALSTQVRLTREVHHRVKNNLQVIASLISLHARGTETQAAGQAYASIQRRVDALAIVHRNHFAELETNHGIEVRALLSGANLFGRLRHAVRQSGCRRPAGVPCYRIGRNVAARRSRSGDCGRRDGLRGTLRPRSHRSRFRCPQGAGARPQSAVVAHCPGAGAPAPLDARL